VSGAVARGPVSARPPGPFEDVPFAALESTVPARFAAIAARHADRVAIRTRHESMTYTALDAASSRVAHALLDTLGKRAEPVALLLDKGIEQLVAYLGVIKAGKIVAVLDPSMPRERLAAMLADADGPLVLTSERRLELARAAAGAERVVRHVEQLAMAGPAPPPRLDLAPDTPMQIVYTSGSTGRPKGVVLDHRTALHQVWRVTRVYRFCAEDVLTMLAALGTGQGTTNAHCALLNGATLCPWDVRADGLADLPAWMLEAGVTVYRSSTSVFRYLVETVRGDEGFPRLRHVVLGSEPAYARDAARFRERFPASCQLSNALSSSECKTIAIALLDHHTPLTERLLPVGLPLDGAEILILDPAGAALPPGEAGRIVVRSRYLASGYWRQPELTRETFRPDPAGSDAVVFDPGDLGRLLPDGSLVHLGRGDFQVKVRGHRVETEEVELALREHAGVRAAAVVARPDSRGETALVGYVVFTGEPLPAAELQRFLRARLPEFMVPSRILALEAMPMTGAGKLDRAALPTPDALAAPGRPGGADQAPRTPLERQLVEIWADVLGVASVGIDEEFGALGGNSLLATRVVARVLDAARIEVPVRALLEAPTVAAMAQAILTQMAEALSPGELDRLLPDRASPADPAPRD
jgi:amino acid adenylation domain-containing protein